VWNSRLCYSPEVKIKDYELTVEEYQNDIALTKAAEEESKEKPNVYYDSLRYKYKYKFNKQYYISTIFYNGNNKLFPIAYCANCDNEGPNAPYEESLILELNNYINSLKIQKHL